MALLLAYKLQRNWDGRIRLLTAVTSAEEKQEATTNLTRLVDLARIPAAGVYAITAPLTESLAKAPQADLSIFGLPRELGAGTGRDAL